jgi:hypothetical protein
MRVSRYILILGQAKRCLSLFSLLFVNCLLFAQSFIAGRILNIDNNEPVGYASIDIMGQRWMGTFADSNGNFKIRTQPNWAASEQLVRISCVGFYDSTFTIPTNVNVNQLSFFLRPFTEKLPEVLVSHKSFKIPRQIGVGPWIKNISFMDMLWGSSIQRSGIGIASGPMRGKVILDSITFHIPSNIMLPKLIILEIYEPDAFPERKIWHFNFPLGKPIHRDVIAYHPNQSGWQTVSLTKQRLVTKGKANGIVVVAYSNYDEVIQKGNPDLFISWAKLKGKIDFSSILIFDADRKVTLLDRHTDRMLHNAYPAMGMYLRDVE